MLLYPVPDRGGSSSGLSCLMSSAVSYSTNLSTQEPPLDLRDLLHYARTCLNRLLSVKRLLPLLDHICEHCIRAYPSLAQIKTLLVAGLTRHIQRQQKIPHRWKQSTHISQRLHALVHQPPLCADPNRVERVEHGVSMSISTFPNAQRAAHISRP